MLGVVAAADVVAVDGFVVDDADAVVEMLKLVSHQFGDRAGQGEGAQRGKDNGDQQKYLNLSFSPHFSSMSSSSGGGDHRQL